MKEIRIPYNHEERFAALIAAFQNSAVSYKLRAECGEYIITIN